MENISTSKKLSFAAYAISGLARIAPDNDRATISDLAKEIQKPVHFIQARMYAARMKPLGWTTTGGGRSYVYDKAQALKVIQAPARRFSRKSEALRSKWRPVPSERMRQLAREAQGAAECPATGLACFMAGRCTFAHDMKFERSGPSTAGKCCLNNTQGIASASTCNKCRLYGESACVFNCFRVERRGIIRMEFYEGNRQSASRSIERTVL